MRTSRLAALAVTVTALAACTPDRAANPPDTAGRARTPGGVLIASTGSGDLAIDATSGALLAGGAGTVAAPDGDALYHATSDGMSTTITSVDPRSGGTVGTQQVRGELDVAVASVSGRAIALVEPVPGAAPGVPVPRTGRRSWSPTPPAAASRCASAWTATTSPRRSRSTTSGCS